MIEFSYFQAIVTIIVALVGGGGLVGFWMLPHNKKKVDAEAAGLIVSAANSLVAGLKDELNRMDEEITELRGEVSNLRDDVKKGVEKEAILLAHIRVLNNHINLELGPPPPDMSAIYAVGENID